MRSIVVATILFGSLWLSACDVQSGITQKSLEKYQPTPTPQKAVVTEEPIDPADIITANASAEGKPLGTNKDTDRSKLECSEYNRVMINGDGHKVEISGACSRVMVNGSGNQVRIEGATEIVTNGSDNIVEYSKYVNGNKPIVTDNSHGANTISKVTIRNEAKPN